MHCCRSWHNYITPQVELIFENFLCRRRRKYLRSATFSRVNGVVVVLIVSALVRGH